MHGHLARWDESGNPACLSKDGRLCWEDSSSCGAKLREARQMLKDGKKLQQLVCGEMHKKVWGSTGYENGGSWCSAAKQAFMEPGVWEACKGRAARCIVALVDCGCICLHVFAWFWRPCLLHG